jgi:tetratricopeptide (TPR) repeat protein
MRRRVVVAAILVWGTAACASVPRAPSPEMAAAVAAYPSPDVPPGLAAPADLRARYEAAWGRVRDGDLRTGGRDLSAILKKAPDFYPAATALGFIDLVNRDYKSAASRFTAATRQNDRYLPAWVGAGDAALGLHDDAAAIAAMERALAIDPRQDQLRGRLELVRLRDVQQFVDAGRAARTAGRFDDAVGAFQRAMAVAPANAMILRELAATESAKGDGRSAELHARRAVEIDPRDGEAWMTLAAVLEGVDDLGGAESAAARAVAIDPRPDWRATAARLHERAQMAGLPAGFAGLPAAATFTRAEAAAYIGIKLPKVLDRAPRRPPPVVTDTRNHWAAVWIAGVTRAGVMNVYPNHTFQPGAVVRRADLAEAAAALVALAGAGTPDLQRWRAARPRFADVAPANLVYRSAALAVAAGVMAAPDGRFEPTRAATGAELASAVARIAELAR